MQNKQRIKRWFMFCEPCGNKEIIQKIDDIDHPEVKRTPVPGGSPRLDPKTNKAKDRPTQKQNQMFKCPKCGRGCVCKKIPDVYSKAYKSIDKEERSRKAEEEKQKRIEDGKPYVRNIDPDYKDGEEPKFSG